MQILGTETIGRNSPAFGCGFSWPNWRYTKASDLWKLFASQMAIDTKGIWLTLNIIWRRQVISLYINVLSVLILYNPIQFFIAYIIFYVSFLTSITTLVLIQYSPTISFSKDAGNPLNIACYAILAVSLVLLLLKHVFLVVYSWRIYFR